MFDDVLQSDVPQQQTANVSQSIPSVTICDFVTALIANITLANNRAAQYSAEENYLNQYHHLISPSVSLKKQYQMVINGAGKDDKRLLALAYHLGLSDYEILTLALLLGVEKNAVLGRCIAFVQTPVGGSRPTLGLLNSVFSQFDVDERFTVSSLLLSGKAIEMGVIKILNTQVPIPEQTLCLPTPLIIALQGLQSVWQQSRNQLSRLIQLPDSIKQQAQKYANLLYQKSQQNLVIRAGCHIEAENIAALITASRRQKPLFLDSTKDNLSGLAGHLFLHAATPVFTLELGPNDNQRIPIIPGYSGPVIVVCGKEGALEASRGSMITWLVEKPFREERFELWQKQLPPGTQFQTMADEQLHSSSRIAELSQLAIRLAEGDNRSQVQYRDLYDAALLNEGNGLGSLAQIVHNKIPDGALVLGTKTKKELDLLLTRCKHRETLSDSLGVTLRSRYQSGVRGLLVGPSGTGKTLAASWLATTLNLPLYRVDLASVSSKYIGETEKNLSQLLNKAEQQEVILLFDEADSMFGKRTDINDANDRFANAQTNYLLQRIENYNGIVLMTSNSRSRFDSAFTRRIDMIIEFQSPKPEERRELWRCHLGDNHSLSQTQLNQLSTVADLCGGHIRNIVLTASLLAKNNLRSIEYADLKEGIKIEYQKLGKKIPIELSKL